MSQYQHLDVLIINAIRNHKNPLYNATVAVEANRLATLLDREKPRVIDGRLQALRRAGKIKYLTKAEGNKQPGWVVVEAP